MKDDAKSSRATTNEAPIWCPMRCYLRYDDACNVVQNAQARGRFQRVVSVPRVKQKAATR